MKSVFITGTDTGIGKTVVTGLLARYLAKNKVNVITQKWVQTGNKGFSKDIASHIKVAGLEQKYSKQHSDLICPYIFDFAASPHLAAKLQRKAIDINKIKRSFKILIKHFDSVIVEGVGGALVPINKNKLVIDIAKDLKLPAIIVVGNKLGAINHTLLTIEALKKRNINIIGIIFNNISKIDNKTILEDNSKIVKQISKENILGTLPYSKNKDLLYKNFIPIAKKVLNSLK